MSVIKVGDHVMWRGAWGGTPPRKVKVVGLETTHHLKDKYGEDVTEVDTDTTPFVATLDNGHWCYGWQLDLPHERH